MVSLHGYLDLLRAPEVEEAVAEVQAPAVTLDVSDLQTVDTTGVAALLWSRNALRAAGKQVRFRGPPTHYVARVLELMGMGDTFFDD